MASLQPTLMHSCLSVSSEPAAFSPFLHTAPFRKCVYNSVICFMPFDHVASCCSSLLIPFPNQGQHGNNQLMLIMLAIGGKKKKRKHCKGFAFLSACLPGQWLNWTVLAAVCLSEGKPEPLKNESVHPPSKQTVWCEHNLRWIYAPSSNWLNIATLPWGSAPCPMKGSILNCRSIATSKKKQFHVPWCSHALLPAAADIWRTLKHFWFVETKQRRNWYKRLVCPSSGKA